MLGATFYLPLVACKDIAYHRSAVHGITDEEIAAGPSFPVAWSRFLSWIEFLLNNAANETDDSEDEPEEHQIVENPILLLAGHNAIRFDLPFLLCECQRNKISVGCFEHWLFADTLHICQAFPDHGCSKLQCLIRSLSGGEDLRAHRAPYRDPRITGASNSDRELWREFLFACEPWLEAKNC